MEGKYAVVNGIRMYYELYGEGPVPLVLVHGAGSTIWGTFGHLLPLLSPGQRVIAVESAHGGTGDRKGPETFRQDADDVAALLGHLGVGKADMLGFGQGGSTALWMAIRHPGLVNRIIVVSAAYGQDGLNDDELRSIRARAMILSSIQDVVTPEHTVRMSRLIACSRLVILPGGHGETLGTVEAGAGMGYADVVAKLVEEFISSPFLRAGRSFAHPFAAPLR